MRILLATNNSAKVERIKKLFPGGQIEWLTLSDLNLEPVEIEEGSDIQKNAIQKALAYRSLTDVSILGMDVAFVIPDEPNLDPAKVKRNALGDRDESKLSQDEIAQLILDYYKELVNKHGGKLSAYWDDAFSLVMPDGKVRTERSRRDVTLMPETKGEINPYFPLRSMYVVDRTGKYVSDQTDEEEKLELSPIIEALDKLLTVLAVH